MLFYNKRKELERHYYDWIEDSELKDCPFAVITFMAAYDLVDEERVLNFLEANKNENSNCN